MIKKMGWDSLIIMNMLGEGMYEKTMIVGDIIRVTAFGDENYIEEESEILL